MDTATAHAGQVVLYHRVTGAAIVRCPVNARELLASGDFTAAPPIGASHAAPVSPEVEHPLPAVVSRRRGRAKAA